MKKHIAYNFLIAISLGLLANGIWLYEVVGVIGWAGLKWLNFEHKSIFIINIFVILAYLFPLWQNELVKQSKTAKLKTFSSLYCSTLIGYYAVKSIIFGYDLFPITSVAPLLVLSIPFVIYWISHKLIHPINKLLILLLTLGFILTLIISNYTLSIIPGFGHAGGIIDAIKMGYPYFWITVIMNAIGMFTERKLLITDQKKWLTDHDDILDA